MKLDELIKRYESVCEEVENLQASYDGHMFFNIFGKSIEEMTNFHKSFNKVKLNLSIKQDEKGEVQKLIRDLKKQMLRDELSGLKPISDV